MINGTLTTRSARAILVIAAAFTLLLDARPALAVNPVPVQLFYVPFRENELLQGLQAINGAAVNPVTSYISIAAVADGTIVYYDQWEDGYDADIANPGANVYSGGNLDGTQIWGDGISGNGAPPPVCVGGPNNGAACSVPSQCPSGTCDTSDLINAGKVIVLKNTINTANMLTIDFDGGDKIAATKTVAVTKTGWAAGSGTLLAGSVEVFDTNSWGFDYRAPVGVNISDTVDYQIFEYTSLYILAGENNTTINVDKDANGVFETTQVLNEGESYFVNGGVNFGGHVTSDKAVQVHMLTGDIGSNYESRDSQLLPTTIWSKASYTPVSTAATVPNPDPPPMDFAGTSTTVWLYNKEASSITVQYTTRNGLGNLVTTPLMVPGGVAGGYLPQVIPDGYGASFTATTPFYAFSTTNSTDSAHSGTPDVNANYTGNQAWDWGYTLVPEDSLTPQLLIGLGIGRDPTSGVNLTENGNPIWVTPVGNINTPVIVYVDFDADPSTGANTDPNGNKYDIALTLKELERAKVYDTVSGDRDQTGTLLYTCGSTVAAGPCDVVPNVKLAGAWGQDPLTAEASAPGLDVGTGVPPLPLFTAGKNGTLYADNDGDGFISPGDVILYTIPIVNISRAPVSNILLQDVLPPDTTYEVGSTTFTDAFNVTTPIADAGGTPFPLDEGGYTIGVSLPVGGSFAVTFRVKIKAFNDLTPGTTAIVNNCTASAGGVTVRCHDTTPLNGCIGDFVWNDLDGDTVQDGGPETGIGSVTLDLYLDVNGNGVKDVGVDTYITSQNTNGSGTYKFLGLLANKYIVDVVDLTVPPGYVLTTANDPKAITLAGGQCDLTADFGYRLPPTSTPTPTRTATPTPTFTILPTTTVTATPTETATSTPTLTPVVTTTPTFTPVVTATATLTPVVTTTATLTPVATSTPTATSTPALCGNMQLDPGETCDPPGGPQPPNNNPCRADCTYCGDTFPNGNESCDDGNTVSGCDPTRPQVPLDPCLNNCQEPICEDPSRIVFYEGRDDVIQVHGRLVATADVDFSDGDFRITLSRRVCSHDAAVLCSSDQDCDTLSPGATCTQSSAASVVFDTTVAGAAIDGNGKRWKYRNPSAKTGGGIYQLKITSKNSRKACVGGPSAGAGCTTAADCPQGSCVGHFAIKLKAYGDAARAVSDMETQIYGGGHGWAVRGIWQQLPKGWRLYKKSQLLDPWL